MERAAGLPCEAGFFERGDVDPTITLFATMPLERDEVNAALRAAGFSPIQSIRKVVQLPEIPCLGSGKTDYRTLKQYQG